MCSRLEGVFVQDATDLDYMQNLSVVLEIVVHGDKEEVFAWVFCSKMEESDDSSYGSIADVKSLLSRAKIPHVIQFMNDNPRMYV